MTTAPRYPGIRVTANGNQLVSYHTETRIADAGIFYPITPSTEGAELMAKILPKLDGVEVGHPLQQSLRRELAALLREVRRARGLGRLHLRRRPVMGPVGFPSRGPYALPQPTPELQGHGRRGRAACRTTAPRLTASAS